MRDMNQLWLVYAPTRHFTSSFVSLWPFARRYSIIVPQSHLHPDLVDRVKRKPCQKK